jgi:hypothetical protein
VLAGQGTAKFIQEGTYKYIPLQFFRRTEFLEVEDYGRFEAYSSSLKYRSVYGLDDVLTLYRGTVRGSVFQRLGICLFNWE